jgi:hypothetical protein
MSSVSTRLVRASALAVLCLSAFGCGEKFKYHPRPAVSGMKANMPPVPNVPQKPLKVGGDWSVWGASFTLRSRVHHAEINTKKITVTGYIGKTNLPDAPECAVHKGGKADPEGCKAPVPTFWLCDQRNDKPEDCIKVMGWASNFAQLYDAIEKYEKDEDKEDAEPAKDTFWGIDIPKPIPGPGAKVTVEATYTTTFTGASTGTAADPIMGILSYKGMKYLEPPPEEAILPGMDEKDKDKKEKKEKKKG